MKSKFFLCFRPVGVETEEAGTRILHCTNDGFCSYVAASRKHKEGVSALASNTESLKISGRQRRSTDSRRRFAGIVKAVFFESSLRKSVRDRKVRQLTLESSTGGWTETTASTDTESPGTKIQRLRPSSLASSPHSSISCSSSTSPQKSRIFFSSPKKSSNSLGRRKQNTGNGKIKSCSSFSNSGINLIVITLFVTVFLGKLFAVLVTSIWLYVVQRRKVLNGNRKIQRKSPEENKKGSQLGGIKSLK